MTQHTSDETLDVPQTERSTDSQSATKTPNQDRGVVQDGPGNPEAGFEDDNSGNGNLTEAETHHPDRDDEPQG